MGLASLIVSIVAVGLALLSWVDGRRSASRANRAAERSAAAAEQSVALSTPPSLAFAFEWQNHVTLALRNVGTSRATGVEIEPGSLGGARVDWRGPTDLDPDQASAFTLITAAGGAPLNTSGIVTCNEHAEPVHVRIPPRPPPG